MKVQAGIFNSQDLLKSAVDFLAWSHGISKWPEDPLDIYLDAWMSFSFAGRL